MSDVRRYDKVISEMQWLVGCHAQVALAAPSDRSSSRCASAWSCENATIDGVDWGSVAYRTLDVLS